MSYTLVKESFPIARAVHKCIWCGESILVGERHRREKSVFCGNFQDHRWHPECNEAAGEYFHDNGGESEFSAYENERPPCNEREEQ